MKRELNQAEAACDKAKADLADIRRQSRDALDRIKELEAKLELA